MPSTRRSQRVRRTTSPTSNEEESEMKQDSSEPTARPGSASDSDDQADQKKKSRSVTFSLDTPAPPSPSISDASSSMKRAVSARAERSLKRQRKIEKEQVQKGPSTVNKFMKPRRPNPMETSTTVFRKGPSGKEEEVVKVKLNTGTLFLYKGIHRRAVFVRRI